MTGSLTSAALAWPPLRLLQPEHRYLRGDVELLATTAVLRTVGLIEDDWYTEESRHRGAWVHLATALLDRSQLDEGSAAERSPSYWPYVAAYLKFLRDAQPEICDIECLVSDDAYGVAGTIDRTCFLNGRWSILDLKTGSEQPWHRLQLASYARLRLNEGRTPDRYGLYLKASGDYRLVPFTDRSDERVFLSCVTVAQWQRRQRHDT